ncbi:MAG TPA: hypothetical protein VK841_21390 [Polyangiaceae bacterium]|jgi:hypothetical protein|nr:hypothetical protein [Polyangiaceae bacterium]
MGPPQDRALDPYAPPRARRESPAADEPKVELPAGIRRYGLDAGEYAKVLRSATLRGFVVMALMYLLFVGFLEFNGLLEEPFIAIPNLVAIPLVFVVIHAYVRRMRRALFAAFEVLVSERVLRRVGPHVGAAEALQPDVTSIFETKAGFVLVCKDVGSALFVSRAVGRYDEIRAHVAPWAPIEPASGLSGWWRAVLASFRQRTRNVGQGAAALRDPSLAAELDLVRAVSSERWKNYSSARVWMRLMWVILAFAIFVFLTGQALLLLAR